MAEYFYTTVQKINYCNVRVRFDCFDIDLYKSPDLFGNILTFNELRDIYGQAQEKSVGDSENRLTIDIIYLFT
jgi:hypothetical protein